VTEPPAVAEPTVSPDKVMVKTAPAAAPAIDVVMTRDVAPVAPPTAVMVATDADPATLAVGVTAAAKNPEG